MNGLRSHLLIVLSHQLHSNHVSDIASSIFNDSLCFNIHIAITSFVQTNYASTTIE